MKCEDTKYLMHAYVDGELDLVHGLEVEKHAAECPGCSSEMAETRRLKGDVEELYQEPPAGLEDRIRMAVRRNSPSRVGRWRLPDRSLAIAASLLAFLMVGWLLGRMTSSRQAQPSQEQSSTEEEVISSHVRSLMQPGHLLDVPSSDQHTVKPWFNGKLDFSPEVVDLADAGFPLEGGRLDYIDGRPVAALVYGRHAHRVNVFIWPSADGRNRSSRSEISKNGYNLIHWTADGFNYWLVSDLNPAELGQLADLLSRGGNDATGSH